MRPQQDDACTMKPVQTKADQRAAGQREEQGGIDSCPSWRTPCRAGNEHREGGRDGKRVSANSNQHDQPVGMALRIGSGKRASSDTGQCRHRERIGRPRHEARARKQAAGNPPAHPGYPAMTTSRARTAGSTVPGWKAPPGPGPLPAPPDRRPTTKPDRRQHPVRTWP